MSFVVKKTREKESSLYNSLYIKEELVKKIEKIARDNDTSFNNVVISRIEHCLKEEDEQ